MRLVLKSFIFLSIVILAIASYKLFDAYTSLKYEVEEPVAMGKGVNEILRDKEHYIKELIFWFWLIIVLQIINIAVSFKVLTKIKA